MSPKGFRPRAALERCAQAGVFSCAGRMIAEQEELDWDVYRLYGILDEDLTYAERRPARVGARGAGVRDRPGSQGRGRRGGDRVVHPARVDADHRDPVALAGRPTGTWCSGGSISSSPTGSSGCWRSRSTSGGGRASRGTSRSSGPCAGGCWTGWRTGRSGSTRRAARRRSRLRSLPTRCPGTPTWSRCWSCGRGARTSRSRRRSRALLADEGVPFLAAYRLKDTGLRKREAWEHTWDLQRREDAGEQVGPIPVPPKYTSADFKQGVVVAAPGQARRAEGTVRPLPGRRPGDRLDGAARLGRLGPRPAGAGAGGDHRRARERGLAGRAAGPAGRRAWPSCNRG